MMSSIDADTITKVCGNKYENEFLSNRAPRIVFSNGSVSQMLIKIS